MCLDFFKFKLKVFKEFEVEIMVVPKSGNDFGNRVGQEFTSKRDKYILNRSTGELEKLPIQEDLQEYVDSFSETALDKIFEKFNGCVPTSDRSAVYGYAEMKGDLSEMANVYDIAEQYRDEFGLGDDMSIEDIYKFVSSQADELKKQIENGGKVDVKEETPVEESE